MTTSFSSSSALRRNIPVSWIEQMSMGSHAKSAWRKNESNQRPLARFPQLTKVVVGPPASSALWFRVFLVDALSFRQHPVVQDARYQDPFGFNPVEQNMPPVFHAAQAGPHVIAGAAQFRVVGKLLATGFEIVDVTNAWSIPHVCSVQVAMSSRSASASRDRQNLVTSYRFFLES